MCLILLAWQAHPEFPLVVAANRDEFLARPTASAMRWADSPALFGGRDLEAGGTWLAATESGRFAAITNVREPGLPPGARSRGELPVAFLQGNQTPLAYALEISGNAYAGFNLLLADEENLVYYSNRHVSPEVLPPGIYGLSNHRLDTPWPKLVTARERFATALSRLPDETPFFDLLADDATVDDALLPKTGVSLDWERCLSAIFVKADHYGTRASTLLWRNQLGAIRLHEKSFGAGGVPLQSSVISTGV